MSNDWNHSCCDTCWLQRCRAAGEPDRVATRVRLDRFQPCCFCGTWHGSGIYIRQDPATLSCAHPGEEEA